MSVADTAATKCKSNLHSASDSSMPLPPSHPPILRVARPTSNISALLPFYTTGLGLTVISSFNDHNGFDGVMLGHPGWPYHLEFTTCHRSADHDETRAPSRDNLLVFYVPDRTEWDGRVERMRDAGFEAVESFNPYWDVDGKGRTFEDADGWRVVLFNESWSL